MARCARPRACGGTSSGSCRPTRRARGRAGPTWSTRSTGRACRRARRAAHEAGRPLDAPCQVSLDAAPAAAARRRPRSRRSPTWSPRPTGSRLGGVMAVAPLGVDPARRSPAGRGRRRLRARPPAGPDRLGGHERRPRGRRSPPARHTFASAARCSAARLRSGSVAARAGTRSRCVRWHDVRPEEHAMAGAMKKMAVYLGLVEESRRVPRTTTPRRARRRLRARRAAQQRPRHVGAPRPPRHRPSRAVDRADERRGRAVPVAAARPVPHHHAAPAQLQRREDDRPGVPRGHPGHHEPHRDGRLRRQAPRRLRRRPGLRPARQIERVTNKVFLLSPANVDVSAEAKARIAEGGFFNQC